MLSFRTLGPSGPRACQVSGLATKADLAAFATKADLAETKADILKWVIGAIGLQTVVVLGAALAIARLILGK